MWYVILFVGGYLLGACTIACFAYRNYNRGRKDAERALYSRIEAAAIDISPEDVWRDHVKQKL